MSICCRRSGWKIYNFDNVMKIKSVSISNFRSYSKEVKIDFQDLTAIVGKNDIGKSTILEALYVFFHNGKELIKLDKDDINISERSNGNQDIRISVVFDSLPQKVVIDESNKTTLKDEYLLNKEGDLEVVKVFKNASTTDKSIIVSIKANHPTNPDCYDLLSKKQAELQKIVDQLGLSCEDKRKNASLRAAIWKHYEDEGALNLAESEIAVNAKDGDIKALWEKLQYYMPYYSLFQSDRKNTDGDDEIQDPLKIAVKQIFSDEELLKTLDDVAQKVRDKLQEVSDLTLTKIKEMNPDIANSLHPKVPTAQELKWADVFKSLSITSDEDIPINKRGSGVKRLILLNFFRAEAERRQKECSNQSIIYAIEEPETSQHKDHQLLLIDALKNLSTKSSSQVIITTHSSDIVKHLEFEQIKIVYKDTNGDKYVKTAEKNGLPYPSLNEVNYIAFGEVSEEYHNELYGFLQSKAVDEDPNNEKEKEFETWLCGKGCGQTKSWIRIKKGTPQPPQPCTIETYIRNFIHHPENTDNSKYSNSELRSSIDEMKKIASSYI